MTFHEVTSYQARLDAFARKLGVVVTGTDHATLDVDEDHEITLVVGGKPVASWSRSVLDDVLTAIVDDLDPPKTTHLAVPPDPLRMPGSDGMPLFLVRQGHKRTYHFEDGQWFSVECPANAVTPTVASFGALSHGPVVMVVDSRAGVVFDSRNRDADGKRVRWRRTVTAVAPGAGDVLVVRARSPHRGDTPAIANGFTVEEISDDDDGTTVWGWKIASGPEQSSATVTWTMHGPVFVRAMVIHPWPAGR